MRSFNLLVASVLTLAATVGCQKSETVQTSDSANLGAVTSDLPNTAVMWVHGMGCPQCAYNVDLQLLKVDGVEKVKVDMGTGRVFATLSPSNPPSQEQLAKAIKETGFSLVRIDMPAPNAGPSS